MTKTDFAELKEKLCEFDILDSSDDFDEYVKQFPVVANNGYSRGITHSYWQTGARHQHTKSSAIISELIEIIKLQSEETKKINNQAGIDIKMVEYETVWVDPNNVKQTLEITQKVREKHFTEICKSLSETTTRLQKLRGNK